MKSYSILVALALLTSACADTDNSITTSENSMKDTTTSANVSSETNPLFTESPLYFNYPPFDKISDAHFAPAMEQGMADQLAEMEAIANQDEPPTFENTLVKMEKSGQLLNRAATDFFLLQSAHTNDALDAIQTEMAPKLSAHNDKILLNPKLFSRVKTLYEQRDSLNLDAESVRLIYKVYVDFVRAGAELSDADKEQLKTINTQLAELQTAFSQNVLKEVNELAIVWTAGKNCPV